MVKLSNRCWLDLLNEHKALKWHIKAELVVSYHQQVICSVPILVPDLEVATLAMARNKSAHAPLAPTSSRVLVHDVFAHAILGQRRANERKREAIEQ